MSELVQVNMLDNMPAELRDLYEQDLEKMKKDAKPAGSIIKVSTEGFTIGNTVIKPPMNVIILGWISRNEFYDRPWKPNEIHPPACFAVGPEKHDKLKPVEESPVPQNDSCETCHNNEFGSDPRGGKLCKNYQILALLPPDAYQSHLNGDEPDIMTLKISPTGLKSFATYLAKLANPPIGPIVPYMIESELTLKSAGSGVTTVCAPSKVLGSIDEIRYVRSRVEEANQLLMQKPDFRGYVPLKSKK